MKLGELLHMKDSRYRIPVTIGLNDTIFKAVRRLVEHDRGSLPVCDDKGNLKGIITERDIVRKCFSETGQTIRIKVKDIMSTKIAIGRPEDDLNYALNVMKQRKIRHLPIVEDNKVIGMISMRDLLGVQLEKCDTQVRFLSDYIQGGSQP